MSEENKNTENITKENPISAPPKQEVVESIPVVEETPVSVETAIDEKVAPIEEVGNKVEVTENKQNNAGLPHSSAVAPELAKTTEEIQPTALTQEIEQPQPIQTQPQIQTIEKIVYKTDQNIVTKLLNKARAKIQERKRKKLDKIMSLFESNSEISNSNIQKLLRTTKRSATRYLNQLEKEQKITQIGKAGRSVKYTKK